MEKLSILKLKEIAKTASNTGAKRKEYKSSDVGRIVMVIRDMGYEIIKVENE